MTKLIGCFGEMLIILMFSEIIGGKLEGNPYERNSHIYFDFNNCHIVLQCSQTYYKENTQE